jgi:hypothetical protein
MYCIVKFLLVDDDDFDDYCDNKKKIGLYRIADFLKHLDSAYKLVVRAKPTYKLRLLY